MSFGIGSNFGQTGEPVTVTVPVTGATAEQTLAKDFDAQITASTASTSKFVAAFRRKLGDASPVIELDSATGLLTVESIDSPTAGDGSVTRDSSTQVSVHIAADAFDHLASGMYHFDLTEITVGGLVILRYCSKYHFTRSAGRTMA